MTTRTGTATTTQTRTATKLKKPGKWNVVMYNDDVTHMEFVVEVLMTVFHHKQQRAMELMLQIHNADKAVVGTYKRDIAETKVAETDQLARQNNFPLKTKAEPAADSDS